MPSGCRNPPAAPFVAVYADWVELIWLDRQKGFYPDRMSPIVSEIVFVQELLTDTKIEIGEPDIARVVAKRRASIV